MHAPPRCFRFNHRIGSSISSVTAPATTSRATIFEVIGIGETSDHHGQHGAHIGV